MIEEVSILPKKNVQVGLKWEKTDNNKTRLVGEILCLLYFIEENDKWIHLFEWCFNILRY